MGTSYVSGFFYDVREKTKLASLFLSSACLDYGRTQQKGLCHMLNRCLCMYVQTCEINKAFLFISCLTSGISRNRK